MEIISKEREAARKSKWKSELKTSEKETKYSRNGLRSGTRITEAVTELANSPTKLSGLNDREKTPKTKNKVGDLGMSPQSVSQAYQRDEKECTEKHLKKEWQMCLLCLLLLWLLGRGDPLDWEWSLTMNGVMASNISLHSKRKRNISCTSYHCWVTNHPQT